SDNQPLDSITSNRSWWPTAIRLNIFQSKNGQNVLTQTLEPRIPKASPINIILASATPTFKALLLSTYPIPDWSPLVDAKSESIEKTRLSLANIFMALSTTL